MNSEEIDQSILASYNLTRKLGKGSYGVVYEASNRATNLPVAIKKCFDCFQNATDAQRTYREITLLQALSTHPNSLYLQDIIPSTLSNDVYLVTDLFESDLNAVIKSGILQDIHRKFIIYQLVNALNYMHSAGVIHRDIKPANILLNSDCCVVLCDFGLARTAASPSPMTDYVATRWYSTPEIILGSRHYSYPTDLWSVGVILGEMLNRAPLFPGTSTLNQLERIVQVTGHPTDEEHVAIGTFCRYNILEAVSCKLPIRPLCDLVPSASYTMLDLMRHLLQFSPDKRATAETAMTHGLLSEFHSTRKVIIRASPVTLPLNDNIQQTPIEYRDQLFRDIPPERKETLHFAEKLNQSVSRDPELIGA